MTEFLKFGSNILLSIIGFLGLFFSTKEVVINLNMYFYILIILFSFFASYGIYRVTKDVKMFIRRRQYKNLVTKLKSLIYYNEI